MKTLSLNFLCVLVLPLVSAVAWSQKPSTSVYVQSVSEQAFSESIEALGTLKANEATVLSAGVTETITAIHFDDNQAVKAGDTLVEMTSREEHAQLAEAQAALDEARRQYARLQALYEEKLTNESRLDQQKAAMEASAAQLSAVKSRMQDRLILAPFDGVVGLRNISVGALVQPGDLITTLDDISEMKLDITLPSVHLNKVQPGLEVIAKAGALNGQSFSGSLVSISPRIDPVTRSVTARARISNKDGLLRPGMLMTVMLKGAQRQALSVAEEALVQVGRSSFVYVVNVDKEPNVVEKREVNLGARQADIVEITSGLNPGELVVVHGAMKLRPGVEVLIAAKSSGAERLPELLKQ